MESVHSRLGNALLLCSAIGNLTSSEMNLAGSYIPSFTTKVFHSSRGNVVRSHLCQPVVVL